MIALYLFQQFRKEVLLVVIVAGVFLIIAGALTSLGPDVAYGGNNPFIGAALFMAGFCLALSGQRDQR